MHSLVIYPFLLLVVSSAVIDRKNIAKQSSDDFGSSEHFLNGVVNVPKVAEGSGKLRKVSDVPSDTAVASKKRELDSLLREIYDNFVLPGKADAQPTTPKPVDFTDLEIAVDGLIKTLKKNEEPRQKDSKEFSSFRDFEAGKEKVATKDDKKLAYHDNIPSYDSFKSKFTDAFVDTKDDEQKLTFGGKKKHDGVLHHSTTGTKSLNELYNELKKEVQIEKESLEKKMSPEKVIEKKEVASNTVDRLQEKKREIVSLLDTLISEQKTIFGGKKDLKTKESTGTKKSVENIFIDSFKRGMLGEKNLKKELNTYVDKERKEMRYAEETKSLNDYIDANRKELVANAEVTKKDEVAKPVIMSESDAEKLRKNVVDLIKVLDESMKKDSTVKKDIATKSLETAKKSTDSAEKDTIVESKTKEAAVKKSEDSSVVKSVEASTEHKSDSTKYEAELDSIAQKKDNEKSLDDMIELLKGFEVDMEKTKPAKRELKDRP